MGEGWTGGQYSLYRGLLGAYLLVHFVVLLPWAAELFSDRGVLPASASPLLAAFPNVLLLSDAVPVVTALVVAGALGALLLLLGFHDRVGALGAWYVLACLFGRNPLISNPSLPFIGWLLLAHVLVPPAPYGSWAARKRADPRGGWHLPGALVTAAWILMCLAYSYSGYTKLLSPSWVDGTALQRVLSNPLARPGLVRELLLASPPALLRLATWSALGLELAFAPLALLRRVRPWIWLAMVGMHAGLLVLVDFAELSVGMLVLHLFTFDPRWIPGRWPRRRDLVLYDGSCALCHGVTRFVLSEDRHGTAFVFAPLPQEDKETVKVRTESGDLLGRSEAVLYLLERLGGFWRVLAVVGHVAPRRLRDAVYDLVARYRYRVFGRSASACPILPADLRSRFQV